MEIVYIIITLIGSYVLGSVLFAIPITRIVIGKDIRKLGNKNPGTSNVVRSVGMFWGIIVMILDAAKGLLPIIIARMTFLTGDTFYDWFILYIIGIFVVAGHCRPVFNKFKKGGGGIGTMLGVSLFFIPIEFIVSLLIGVIITFIFMKNAAFKFGRWTPTIALTVLPFFTLAINYVIDIKLFAHISIGGHPSAVVIGVFLMSIAVFLFNASSLSIWTKNTKMTDK